MSDQLHPLGHLGVDVRLAEASQPLSTETVTAGERVAWQHLGSEARRHDWLLGRAALKALLPPGFDTSTLTFPHPRLSLTHAGGTAWAARIGHGHALDGSPPLGVGIDFEPRGRAPDARAARFFLSPDELAAASGPADLLGLWTVKEALYKATPHNLSCALVDFRIDDPTAVLGTARGPRGETLRYSTVEVASGLLTVAVCSAPAMRVNPTKARHHAAV